jgi:hypothetical protein
MGPVDRIGVKCKAYFTGGASSPFAQLGFNRTIVEIMPGICHTFYAAFSFLLILYYPG